MSIPRMHLEGRAGPDPLLWDLRPGGPWGHGDLQMKAEHRACCRQVAAGVLPSSDPAM